MEISQELVDRAEKYWKEQEERNAFIIESLLIKVMHYLDDQAKEEFINSLDDEHKIMLTAVTKFGKEL